MAAIFPGLRKYTLFFGRPVARTGIRMRFFFARAVVRMTGRLGQAAYSSECGGDRVRATPTATRPRPGPRRFVDEEWLTPRPRTGWRKKVPFSAVKRAKPIARPDFVAVVAKLRSASTCYRGSSACVRRACALIARGLVLHSNPESNDGLQRQAEGGSRRAPGNLDVVR